MRPAIRSVLITIAVFLAAMEAEAYAEFPITSIVVQGSRSVSEEILLGEAQLLAGRSYTEEDLRAAVRRIRRLPFVVQVDFRLQRGEEVGTYQLVVEIIEAAPLFVSFNWLESWVDLPPSRHPVTGDPIGRGQRLHGTSKWGSVGLRTFMGSKGALFASSDWSRSSDLYLHHLGYTHYDALGTGGQLSAVLSYFSGDRDYPTDYSGRSEAELEDHLSLRLTASLPIGANQAITAEYGLARTSFARSSPTGPPEVLRPTTHLWSAGWFWDTTEDPLFPRKGVEGGIALRGDVSRRLEEGQITRSSPVHGFASAVKYWPVGLEGALHTGVSLETVDTTSRLWVGSIETGYSRDLWSPQTATEYGDLVVEARARWVGQFEDDRSRFSRDVQYGEARIGLSFRNEWGILTFGLHYRGWEGDV